MPFGKTLTVLASKRYWSGWDCGMEGKSFRGVPSSPMSGKAVICVSAGHLASTFQLSSPSVPYPTPRRVMCLPLPYSADVTPFTLSTSALRLNRQRDIQNDRKHTSPCTSPLRPLAKFDTLPHPPPANRIWRKRRSISGASIWGTGGVGSGDERGLRGRPSAWMVLIRLDPVFTIRLIPGGYTE